MCRYAGVVITPKWYLSELQKDQFTGNDRHHGRNESGCAVNKECLARTAPGILFAGQKGLIHRVQCNPIAFTIDEMRDVAILADRSFWYNDLATGGFNTGEWPTQVFPTIEIDDRSC